MRIFEVRITSQVTILEEEVVCVGAADEADARQAAEEAFRKAMDAKYGWCDYDTVYIEECVEC